MLRSQCLSDLEAMVLLRFRCIFLVLSVAALVSIARAQEENPPNRCYSCTVSNPGPEDPCVENPAAVTTNTPVVNCDKTYCTLRRTELKDTEAVFQFWRGCESNPDILNGEIEDYQFKYYHQSCRATKEPCNIGDGLENIDGSNPNGPDGGGPMGNHLVEGMNFSTSIFQRNTRWILAPLFLISLWRFHLGPLGI
ncbi:unnamed protein product [Cyprideis torosa]|uniref:Uncharacterized protein n=1 Tax=Cyprideis torosa TaxID=163714 RepID=A0A7R8ZIT8_9CRUS|nr:unnamed protein product [Cyprideis torosa]CAG0886955.1 unnamed protein product [Cyprideis torosa]